MDSIPPTPQHSQWTVSDSRSEHHRPLPSGVLNLLGAIATTKLNFYESDALRLHHDRGNQQVAGVGAFGSVEVGRTVRKQIVAVKKSKALERPLAQFDNQTFEQHLNQVCLEVRVLTIPSLRSHPNVLDILGVCINSYSGYPVLSLVLEYSEVGDVASFLKSQKPAASAVDRFDFVVQLLSGLAALHEAKVCHGDVKIQNTLVFRVQQGWRVKISDFGLSIATLQDEPSAAVSVPFGTRLLNAPEVRKGTAIASSLFTIYDAMATDVYSFGLLAWEIMKHGASYFDDKWMKHHPELSNFDDRELYLNSIPSEVLYLHALDFLEFEKLNSEHSTKLSAILNGSLRESPQERIDLATLAMGLNTKMMSLRFVT